MYQVTLSYKQKQKVLNIESINHTTDLIRLIQLLFELTSDVIGITDTFDKFYDIQYAATNIATLHQQKFHIITTQEIQLKQNNESPQHNSESAYTLNEGSQHQDMMIASIRPSHCLGEILNLQLFQSKLLTHQLTVIISAQKIINKNLFSFYFYYLETKQSNANAIKIYLNKKLQAHFQICQNLHSLNQKIVKYLAILHQIQISTTSKIYNPRENRKKKVQKQKSCQLIKKAYERLLIEERIDELHFYKFLAKHLQNPQYYLQKYLDGWDGLDQEQLYDLIREDVEKRQLQLNAYGSILHYIPEQETRFDIPIYVRKHNNMIQKITPSNTFTFEQEQAFNLLQELELKGLTNEVDTNTYRKYLINSNQQILSLFANYFDNSIDQIQLSHQIKELVRKVQKSSPGRSRKDQIN